MTTQPESHKQSRLGKRPVALPDKVQATINGESVTLKGPKGEISRTFRPEVSVVKEGNALVVKVAQSAGRAGLKYQGLTRALLDNMATGVSEGFKRSLDLRGVGYRAEQAGNELKMVLGLSHGVTEIVPDGVSVKIETIDEAGTKYPRVHLESVDNEKLGQLAARIRAARPPEPYKGKGVRYTGEQIKQKAGKAGKAGK